jgi:hypothetical protein
MIDAKRVERQGHRLAFPARGRCLISKPGKACDSHFKPHRLGLLIERNTTESDKAKHVSSTEIDLEYQRRLDAMSIMEKVQRSAAMLAWTRQQMAARIRTQFPKLTDEQIKWHVALELYEAEPAVVAMIRGHLADVSR